MTVVKGGYEQLNLVLHIESFPSLAVSRLAQNIA